MGSYSRVKGPKVKYSQRIWKPPNGEAGELPTMRAGGLEEQVLDFSFFKTCTFTDYHSATNPPPPKPI